MNAPRPPRSPAGPKFSGDPLAEARGILRAIVYGLIGWLLLMIAVMGALQ